MVSDPLGLAPSMYIPIIEVGTSISHKHLRCTKGVGDGLESIQCCFGGSTGFELKIPHKVRVCVENKEDRVVCIPLCLWGGTSSWLQVVQMGVGV